MRTDLLLASVGIAAGVVAGANADIILDQPTAGGGAASQMFEPAYGGAYDCAGFDDFTLLSTWDLTSLTVYGVNSPGGDPSFNNSVSLWINSSPVYQTGTQVFGSQTGGDLTFDLTGITLAAGTYWISVQVDRPFAGGGQWYWSGSNTTNGSASLWQNPGGGFGNGTGLIDAEKIDGAYDRAFTLEGNKVPAPGAIALLGFAGLLGRRRR